jgi:hypothetical protein
LDERIGRWRCLRLFLAQRQQVVIW